MKNEDALKNPAANPWTAAAVGLVSVLPFALFEFASNTLTTRSAPGVAALFGLLWLLAAAFVFIMTPLAREARAGGGVAAKPVSLLLRVTFSALILLTWVGIVADQLPCFLGVPNCD